MARHGFWILWLDPTKNELNLIPDLQDNDSPVAFGKPDKKSKNKYDPSKDNPHWRLFAERIKERGYPLGVGAGSAGLALRLGTGVCLRDTIRDTRGTVAFEDILSRNYSFMGVPIKRQDVTLEGGMDTTPFLFFCMLFPARGAWHTDDMGCSSGGGESLCLYAKIKDFCDKTVAPLAEALYERAELTTWKERANAIVTVRQANDDKLFDNTLRTLVGHGGNAATNGGGPRNALRFSIAAIYDGSKTSFRPQREQAYLDKLRLWKLSQLKSAPLPLRVGSDTLYVVLSPAPVPIPNMQPFENSLSPLLNLPEKPWPPGTGSDPLRAHIERIKWKEVVLTKACEFLATKLVAPEAGHVDAALEALKVPHEGLGAVSAINDCLFADIKVAERWAFTVAQDDALSEALRKRLEHELHELPYTRIPLLRLLDALYLAEKMPPKVNETIVVTVAPSAPIGDYPLRSEAGVESTSEALYDYGVYSVLNDQNVWHKWGLTEVNDDLKVITITARDMPNKYMLRIGKANIDVERLTAPRPEVSHVVAHASRSPALSADEDGLAGAPGAWDDILALMKKTPCCGKDQKDCFPCACRVALKWHVHPARVKPGCGEQCHWLSEGMSKSLEAAVQATFPDDVKYDDCELAVTAFGIVPLRANDEEQLAALLITGSPRREYDDPASVRYSDNQLSLLHLTSDYLASAINLRARIAAEEQRAAAEGRSTAAEEKWQQVVHLKGMEPEVRAIIKQIESMKRAAMRLSAKVAPLSTGVLAYNEAAILLFRPNTELSIDFHESSQEVRASEECIKDLFERPRDWEPAMTMSFTQGRLDLGRAWLFKTKHSPTDAGFDSDAWEKYRRILFLLGLACANQLLQDIARWVPSSFGEDTDSKSRLKRKAKECGRIFNFTKLLFHRLHHPGAEEEQHYVYGAQLLAALVSTERMVVLNEAPRKPIFYRGNYGSLIEDCIREGASLTGWVPYGAEVKNSRYWRLSGRGSEFIAALGQFLAALPSSVRTIGDTPEKNPQPSSAAGKQEYPQERKTPQTVACEEIWLTTTKEGCTIRLLCSGEFKESVLQLPQEHGRDQGEGVDDPEHDFARAYSSLERCLRASPGGQIMCHFKYYTEAWKSEDSDNTEPKHGTIFELFLGN